MSSQKTLQCSNSFVGIISEGFKEIVGEEDLLLFTSDMAKSSPEPDYNEDGIYWNDRTNEDYQKFLDKFGSKGSRGVAYRIGGASFGHFIRSIGENYNLATTEYHLKNYSNRCLYGLNKLAEFLKENCGIIVEIINQQDRWLVEVSKNADHKKWNQLWGDFLTGMFREYLTWTSGGRFFVMNTLPNDQVGDLLYCLTINKQPLGN